MSFRFAINKIGNNRKLPLNEEPITLVKFFKNINEGAHFGKCTGLQAVTFFKLFYLLITNTHSKEYLLMAASVDDMLRK